MPIDLSDLGPQTNKKVDLSDLGPTQPTQTAKPTQPPSAMMQAFQKLFDKYPSIRAQLPTTAPDPLARIGEAEANLNQRIQSGAGQLAEKYGTAGAIAGTIAGTTGDFFLNDDPKSKLRTALSLIPAVGAAGKLAKLGEAAPEAAKVLGTVVKAPTGMQKAEGTLIGAMTGKATRFAQALAADPEILDSKTPDLKEVSNKYTAYFKKIGEKIDNKLVQETLKQDYFPDEKETNKLLKITNNVKAKLLTNQPVSVSDLFTAERAAAAIRRGDRAFQNPELRKAAEAMQEQFSLALENQGAGELKELGRQWFRAKVKDAFQSIFPTTSTGKPAFVRSALMFNEFKKALDAGLDLKPGKAALAAAKGAVMSPFLAGQMLRSTKVATPIKAGIPPALQRMLKRRQNKSLEDIRASSNPSNP